jgi:hypothetical protein
MKTNSLLEMILEKRGGSIKGLISDLITEEAERSGQGEAGNRHEV